MRWAHDHPGAADPRAGSLAFSATPPAEGRMRSLSHRKRTACFQHKHSSCAQSGTHREFAATPPVPIGLDAPSPHLGDFAPPSSAARRAGLPNYSAAPQPH